MRPDISFISASNIKSYISCVQSAIILPFIKPV